jgi:hypothetical protein
MGSGAVGVEFASIFNRFGSKVTLIELLPRLVPVEDEAVSAELARSFKKQGITSLVGTKVTRAEVEGTSVSLDAQAADGKTQTITADYLLVATGRGPVTDGLGVDTVGLALERGYVRVDNLYRTNVEGISAIGDVITFGEGTGTRSSRTSRRPRAFSWPNASPATRYGRSTTTTCPAARTVIPRSAASASPKPRRASEASTCRSARSRSGFSGAPAWPTNWTAS